MTSVTIQQAQSHLDDLIAKLAPGDELVITRDDAPVAKLVPVPAQIPVRAFETDPAKMPWGVPIPGRGKGMLIINGDDDEPLADFAEYME